MRRGIPLASVIGGGYSRGQTMSVARRHAASILALAEAHMTSR